MNPLLTDAKCPSNGSSYNGSLVSVFEQIPVFFCLFFEQRAYMAVACTSLSRWMWAVSLHPKIFISFFFLVDSLPRNPPVKRTRTAFLHRRRRIRTVTRWSITGLSYAGNVRTAGCGDYMEILVLRRFCNAYRSEWEKPRPSLFFLCLGAAQCSPHKAGLT